MSEQEKLEQSAYPLKTTITLPLNKKGRTICKEYDEFASWVMKRFPSLYHEIWAFYFAMNYANKRLKRPGDNTPSVRLEETLDTSFWLRDSFERERALTPDMHEAIISISKEYIRRCKAISSSHECKADFCIHHVFERAIEDVVDTVKSITRLEANGLRHKLAESDEREAAVRREEKALRNRLEEKDREEAALRREVKALHEKVEAAEKALREKAEAAEMALREKESVYKVFREVMGMPAKPQRSSDAKPDSYRDDRSLTPERQRRSGWDGQYPSGTGAPQNPRTLPEKHREEKVWQDARDFGKSFPSSPE